MRPGSPYHWPNLQAGHTDQIDPLREIAVSVWPIERSRAECKIPL
jgi:hypothetical protein